MQIGTADSGNSFLSYEFAWQVEFWLYYLKRSTGVKEFGFSISSLNA